MAIHFSRAELMGRISRAKGLLSDCGLDAILCFSQESDYYLTGYDTSGYVFFQCLILTADEQPVTLLTRRPDLEQARHTSIIEDIRVWYDSEQADPTVDLQAILEEKGLKGGRIGVELNTFGLTGFNHQRLRQRLDDWCRLEDASNLVRRLRVVKSAAEIGYVRRAAELADESLEAMLETAGPGVFEGNISAAGQSVSLRGGDDLPPSGPVLGSGERALLIRSATGHRHLDPVDQLTLEFASSYRRYCACLMRTVAIGQGNDRQRHMFGATRDAMTAMTAAAAPGRPLGEIDDAHRRVFDDAGFGDHRGAACFSHLARRGDRGAVRLGRRERDHHPAHVQRPARPDRPDHRLDLDLPDRHLDTAVGRRSGLRQGTRLTRAASRHPIRGIEP
jgi:Xaa-Pro dipeptidase